MNDRMIIKRVLIALSVIAGMILPCMSSAAQNPTILPFKESERKPLIYHIGVSAYLNDSAHEYSSIHSEYNLTGIDYGIAADFSVQMRPFLKHDSYIGISLGYLHEDLVQKENGWFALREHDYVDIDYVTISPNIAIPVMEILLIKVGYLAKVRIAERVTCNSMAIQGFNEDCLKRFRSDIYIRFGIGLNSLSMGMYVNIPLDTGPADLDKLYYYDRARFGYSDESVQIGAYFNVSIFMNGM